MKVIYIMLQSVKKETSMKPYYQPPLTDSDIDFLKKTVFYKYPKWCIGDNILSTTTSVYIDEQNLISSARQLGMILDLNKFKFILDMVFNHPSIHIFIPLITKTIADEFNASIELGSRPISINNRYADWLNQIGYHVTTKLSRVMINAATGVPTIKRNLDVDMATKVMTTHHKSKHIILVTGDGDFEYLVKQLQALSHVVTIISTNETDQKMLAKTLVNQADYFIDLNHLINYIKKEN